MQGVLVAAGVVPSTAPTVGPCSAWAAAADACAPCTAATADLDSWIYVASELLYELSGQRFPGICTDTVRPCAQCAGRGDWPARYDDASVRYQWFGSCGCGGDACGCETLSELHLSGWPLVSVDEVLIDGNVVDPALYRIDDWGRLVRLRDPDATSPTFWPACQHLDLPTTEEGTFQVTFRYGQAPPRAGVSAAATLGCQLALACAGDSGCRLPQRVQSITRQGVSMVMLDPFQFLENGTTGLYDVDLFLSAYGPMAKKRWPAVVSNPNRYPRVRRTTG